MSRQPSTEELEQKLSSLKTQREKLADEASEWTNKRDKLNEQVKNLRADIIALKVERDGANEQVKKLKQKRSELKTQVHEKINELNKLKDDYRAMLPKRPAENYQILQKTFETLEWKIQTTSLSVQEENYLVEQVKQTEIQLNVYKKIGQIREKMRKMRAEIESLNTEGKQCHERLTLIAQKSQAAHEKMLIKLDESKKARAEADSLHQSYVQTREKSRNIQGEMTELLAQVRKLRDEARGKREEEKKQAEKALRDKLENSAREKLKHGGKLTWEEFQLLGENETETKD